ncbi:plastocyanin/azurin family copper-binding protein [Hoyosella sp. YIM 151337]|uniref:plastocyanin/azurin family copper-binding protein n=1 Tax=Hoyosella sp. YIM 151337 TaxID=2992742 RepID=UPI002235E21E|nr:plastocyanin/azurin family copper-binding protein [Hoyosella sp. YIM 151337]MCW4354678.1 plastocyanin/azurin family copper-binding protein [Hoyosella sp. YIM 151337]
MSGHRVHIRTRRNHLRCRNIHIRPYGDPPRALEIEGEGIEESSDTIGPGETTELTVTLELGTYELYCPFGNHQDQGMTVEITVE